jgi:hypothetical protein
MRIGGEKQWEKETSLYDWVHNNGYGLTGLQGREDLPCDLIAFCESQYLRFNVPVPPEEVIRTGAWASHYYLDFEDPYAYLCGLSDVHATDDWANFAYEVTVDEKIHEANPEQLESFTFVPGGDVEVFNECIAKPGLAALPYSVGDAIDEILWGDHCSNDPLYEDISADNREWLIKQCGDEVSKIMPYFQLSAWAAFLWFIGPPGRVFRYQYHDIFFAASRSGYAYLYEGMLISGEHVKRLARSPESCVNCGLGSWCVDLAHIDGVTRHMCERCLNGSVPLHQRANCGTRSCRFTECPHHCEFGKEDALYRTLSGSGQLSRLAEQKRQSLAQGPLKLSK